MRRSIRYQAAVVLDDHLLLLKVLDGRSGKLFWVFPGGGQEPGETEEECIEREMREETISVLRWYVFCSKCPTFLKVITIGFGHICASCGKAPRAQVSNRKLTKMRTPSFGKLAGLISGGPTYGIRCCTKPRSHARCSSRFAKHSGTTRCAGC
jgi:hypothetical protein